MYITQKTKERLLKHGNWMIRMDKNGISYGGFKWKDKKWNKAPDWNTTNVNFGGLFGQNHLANGFCTKGSGSGKRAEFWNFAAPTAD